MFEEYDEEDSWPTEIDPDSFPKIPNTVEFNDSPADMTRIRKECDINLYRLDKVQEKLKKEIFRRFLEKCQSNHRS